MPFFSDWAAGKVFSTFALAPVRITGRSKARAVTVELKVVWGQAWLLIGDDEAELTPERMFGGSIGLASARERLLGLNGTFKVMSETAKGHDD